MANKHLGEEEVILGGNHYLFHANFRFIADLKEVAGIGPMFIYNRLSNDEEADPTHIKHVLACSLKKINGDEVSPDEVDLVVEDFITKNGMELSWVVAQHMLSYAMIGDEKKSEIQEASNKIALLEKLSISRSVSSRSPLSLWIYRLMFFGSFLCSSISLLSLLILHEMDLMNLVMTLIKYLGLN